MEFGSLFSGIGGLDLGLEQAGMTCVWQVEDNEFRQKVLAKHWPNVTRFSDVRECGKHNLERVDLIAGGFPCQDISSGKVIGPRLGLAGARSGLWYEFLRIICELRPRYVLVENVAALLGRGMGGVLGGLASIGYDAEWTMLRGCDFGSDQRRRRIFIIAYPSSERGQGLEPGKNPRFFGPGRWGSKENLSLADWRTRPLFNRGAAPLLCRREDGIPDRVQRLEGIGNAVMPPVAKWIGQQILSKG